MRPDAKTYAICTALAVFVGLPLLFYALGDAPRRSLLKEALSILTLLSFSLMLGQFFLARSNEVVLSLFKPPQVQKVHKYIAYGAISMMLLHPFLIVLPRYFEAGVKPWDAFVTMLTTWNNLGVVLGLIAWVLMLMLGATSLFRMRVMSRTGLRYRGWRYFHGGMAVTFMTLGIWHAIELGRHTDLAMSLFLVVLALLGVGLLARLYWSPTPKRPTPPAAQGAQS